MGGPDGAAAIKLNEMVIKKRRWHCLPGQPLTDLDKQVWFDKIKAMCEPLGFTPNLKEYKQNPDIYKGHVGDVSTVIRIALTGRTNTPDLHSIIAVLGTDEVKARLEKAEKKFKEEK